MNKTKPKTVSKGQGKSARKEDYEILFVYPKPMGIRLFRRPGFSKNIYFYFSHNKKAYSGSTHAESLEKAQEYVIEKWNMVNKGIKDEPQWSFKRLCAEFITHKKTSLKPKTIRGYENGIKYLCEKFGDREVSSFTPADVYAYQKWRRFYWSRKRNNVQTFKRDGKSYKGRTYNDVSNVVLNREQFLLCTILKFAQVNLDLLQGKPIPTFEYLPEKSREDILDKDEYEKLKEYWMRKKPYYWYIFSFLNNTGLRPGELFNLKWKDILFDKSVMIIRDRKSKKKEPQNMPVVLTERARAILEHLRSRKGIPLSPESYIWVNDRGVRVVSLDRPFQKSVKDCGIDKHLTLYSFRHLYATRMVKRADTPLLVIAQNLGHIDTTMLERKYQHLRIDDRVKIIQQSETHREQIIRQKIADLQKELSEMGADDDITMMTQHKPAKQS